MNLRFALIFFIFLTVFEGVKSQTKEDLLIGSMVFDEKDNTAEYKLSDFDINNEVEALAYGSFVFYKTFISSQDGDACIFYPSCSVYMVQSIKKHGFAVGILDGIDRLQRCNKLSPNNYKMYKNTRLLCDTVE